MKKYIVAFLILVYCLFNMRADGFWKYDIIDKGLIFDVWVDPNNSSNNYAEIKGVKDIAGISNGYASIIPVYMTYLNNWVKVECVRSSVFKGYQEIFGIDANYLEEIGKEAFANTLTKKFDTGKYTNGSGLYSLPNLEMVRERAFADCHELESVRLRSGIYYQKGAFAGCENINYIELTAGERKPGTTPFTTLGDNIFDAVENAVIVVRDIYFSFPDNAFSQKAYDNAIVYYPDNMTSSQWNKFKHVYALSLYSVKLAFTQPDYDTTVGDIVRVPLTQTLSEPALKDLTWNIDDPEIASVSNDGYITPIKEGRTTLTVLAPNGSTASCEITVHPQVSDLHISLSDAEIVDGETTIYLGSTHDINVQFLPTGAIETPYTVETSNSEIVNVQEDKIYAKSLGSINLTVTTESGISKVIRINVAPISVTALKIIPEQLKLKEGETSEVQVLFTPENATDKTLAWTTSDEKIATVDSEGKIIAHGIGQCAIVAKSANGVTAYSIVTVVPTPAESLTIDKVQATLHVGDIVNLTAEVLPLTTTDKTIIWTTSDSSVATVDEEGAVRATGIGETTITARCGSLTAGCFIKVVETPVSSITIDKTSVEMHVAETLQLAASVLPENATNKDVVWTSFNESVASVNDKGLVTAIKEGSAIIQVKCGSVSAICQVNVIDTDSESITIDVSQATLLVGESIQLSATVLPETTTNKSVTWSTSDFNIAVVNETGFVTAIAVGEATIIATTANGLKATCEITVNPVLVESLTISPECFAGEKNDTFIINTTILPTNATNKTLKFTSTNETVAKVDKYGKVTILDGGTAVINVETTDGSNLLQECDITITSGIDSLFKDNTGRYDIYDSNGILIQKNVGKDYLHRLSNGVYIIRQGNNLKKILLTSH